MVTPSKVLPISCYEVSRANPMGRINKLDEFRENLSTHCPEYVDQIIDGYKLVGKTSQYQQYVGELDGEYYNINIKKIKGIGNKTNGTLDKTVMQREEKDLVVKTTKLKDIKYNADLFVPIVSNTPLDKVFSNQGGLMPATNYIVIGDPGIGKSSLTIEYVAQLQQANPDKKILFISAEMTIFDMIPYTERFPLWAELDILFTSELEEGYYMESVEQKLQEGYDVVLTDSFAELTDAVRGDWNDFNNKQKSKNDLEKWFIDLMVSQNGAENNLGKNTSFISIQQVNKGGEFVGSNKLKHNTTGMIELRYTKSGNRKIHISKNRRGFEYQDLEFSFGKEGEDAIKFNIAKIKRDQLAEQEVAKVEEAIASELDDGDAWMQSLIGESEEELMSVTKNSDTDEE
jgi:predicted ATP-dependent serine protease